MASGDTNHDLSSLRTMVLIIYGLLAVVPLSGFTAIIAVALAYAKRDDARDTIYEGHFRNAIILFWTALVALALVGAIVIRAFAGVLVLATQDTPHLDTHPLWSLLLLPFGYFAAIGFVVWYFYRLVRGVIRAVESRPYAEFPRVADNR